jgi:hypothetical protein
LVIGTSLRDPNTTHSLTNSLTLGAASTWTLLPLPNLPLWPGAGTFVNTPGALGYVLGITLACGTTFMSPTNGTWQSGNFLGAVGQSNFAAQAVNSTFDIAFVQHEPGSQCTTPMDCPFRQNYDDCLRYYYKTWDYGTAVGTATDNGSFTSAMNVAGALMPIFTRFPVPMAKIPTVSYWSRSGVAGNVDWIGGGGSWAISSQGAVGTKGPTYIGFSASHAVDWIMEHLVADTGW